MNEPPQDPGRKSLPHLPSREFPNQSVAQFISCNVANRRPLLARPEIHRVLLESWHKADQWLVGRYVIMPDHVHFFCAPHNLHFGIDQWIEFWKSRFSRRHLEQPWSWQRKSFHHRLRNRIEYEDKLIYVRKNPLRKQLVSRPDEWRYQGRIHDLRWTTD